MLLLHFDLFIWRQWLPKIWINNSALLIFSLLACNSLCGQTALTLSSASASSSSGVVSLNLSLTSPAGVAPAGLQWTINAPADVTGIAVTAGPSLTAAAKSVSCAGTPAAYICVASGVNSNTIPNGVIATLAFSLSSISSTTPIELAGALAASLQASAITVSDTGGSIGPPVADPPTVTSLQCTASSLAANANTTCTVGVSSVAPSGGTTVALSSSITALTVPASVTVPAGATSASFTAAAGAIASSQSATLTAALNGSSATAAIALVLQPTVSLLSCSPTSFTAANQTSSCTVTVANPSGSVSVSLSSDNAALIVKAPTVALAANSATANFTVLSGTFTSNQTAHLTASLNGSSQTVTFSLTTLPVVTSLQCAASSLAANANTTCTVGVSSVAPSGGTTVALSSSITALTVPASVTVPAGATSATFTAAAGAIASSQSATLTAALNGSSATAAIALVLSRPSARSPAPRHHSPQRSNPRVAPSRWPIPAAW